MEEGRASTRFIPGMMALTSLMAFAFWAASIFVRLTLKTVFSFGAAFSGSSAAPPAGAPAEAAAGAAAGMAMSTMLRRDLRASTRSAASRRVRVEIWSTMPATLGE